MQKKHVLFTSIATSIMVVSGCGNSNHDVNPKNESTYEAKNEKEKNIDVREVAWNQIGETQKSHIVGTWNEATVNKQVIEKFGGEVYIVSFPTTDHPTIGDISVYISTDKKKFLGFGARD